MKELEQLTQMLIEKIQRGEKMNNVYTKMEGHILLEEYVIDVYREAGIPLSPQLESFNQQHEVLKKNPNYKEQATKIKDALIHEAEDYNKIANAQQFLRFYDADQFVCGSYTGEVIEGIKKASNSPVEINCHFRDNGLELRLGAYNPGLETFRKGYQAILSKAEKNPNLVKKITELYEGD